MQVPPHPHTGLQTVSWLFDGHVLHRDSLGSQQLIRPGELNLMTSGAGIAHSEESPRGRPPVLHGLQLWIALPDSERFTEPAFAHHAALPVVRHPDATVTVVIGSYEGSESPALTHSPLSAWEVAVDAGAAFILPVRPDHEYGIVSADGPAPGGGAHIEPGMLAHLAGGVSGVPPEPARGGRDRALFFVMGGEPFREQLVMWWNLVARTAEEITR